MIRKRLIAIGVAATLLGGGGLAVVSNMAQAAPPQDEAQGGEKAKAPAAKLAELAEGAERGLGSDESAGSWVDRKTGKLVVNVTSGNAVPKSLKSTDVQVRQVTYSTRQLATLKSRVDAAAERHKPRDVSWYVDVPTNTMTVTVNKQETDEATDAFVNAVRATGGAVRIKKLDEPLSPNGQVLGGDEIKGGGISCSTGFNATNSEGKDFLLTAGHCVEEKKDWVHSDGIVGRRGTFNAAPHDWGVVHYDATPIVRPGPTNQVNTYGSDPLRITGPSEAPVGSQVCHSGGRTGFNCGTVTAHGVNVSYSNGVVVEGMSTAMGMCSLPGDSGGSIVQPAGDGTATAQGLLSGSTEYIGEDGKEKCPHDDGKSDNIKTTIYEPIERALAESNLSLRTEPFE